MSSFFKGLIRGLLAVIPICLIVCALFAGQRLILKDKAPVSSEQATSDNISDADSAHALSGMSTGTKDNTASGKSTGGHQISAGGSKISHGESSQNSDSFNGTTTSLSGNRSDTDTIEAREHTQSQNIASNNLVGSGNTTAPNDHSKSGATTTSGTGTSDGTTPEPVLSFVGDMLFTENTLSRYNSTGITSMVSEELLSAMTGADLFMVNEEFPFSTRGEAAEDKQFTFRVDPSYVRIFQELGVDVTTVANNHALDFGVDAFTDSLDTLDQAGIARVGGGRTLEEAKAPVIRTVGDTTVGILGASRVIPVSSWAAGSARPGMFTAYDQTPLLNEISDLSAQCDHTLVYLHWGIEKDEYPQEYQRKLAYACIDAGADLVIGSHPHVLQGFEMYKGKLIVYSLGNFIFSNNANPTVLLQVQIKRDGTMAASLIPCVRVNGQMQRNTAPAALLSHLTELSYGVQVTADSDGNGQITAVP